MSANHNDIVLVSHFRCGDEARAPAYIVDEISVQLSGDRTFGNVVSQEFPIHSANEDNGNLRSADRVYIDVSRCVGCWGCIGLFNDYHTNGLHISRTEDFHTDTACTIFDEDNFITEVRWVVGLSVGMFSEYISRQ